MPGGLSRRRHSPSRRTVEYASERGEENRKGGTRRPRHRSARQLALMIAADGADWIFRVRLIHGSEAAGGEGSAVGHCVDQIDSWNLEADGGSVGMHFSKGGMSKDGTGRPPAALFRGGARGMKEVGNGQKCHEIAAINNQQSAAEQSRVVSDCARQVRESRRAKRTFCLGTSRTPLTARTDCYTQFPAS